MASEKHLLYILLLYGTVLSVAETKIRPLAFVLCLKGFRWDLPYSYPHLIHFRRLSETGSKALWVETEFGGTQTNILSLMSGIHVEDHARTDFIETIPVLNEHVGGHTRLFHWPWFSDTSNISNYEHLRSERKGQPEIIEPYVNHGRMSLQSYTKYITSMLSSLINDNDRTNLIMSFIDEPYATIKRHGIESNNIRRIMLNIDRLIGRLLSVTSKNNINLIIVGDHGIEQINCRQPIHLNQYITKRQLNLYTDQYSGTSFSFVVYPKTDIAHRFILKQLEKLPKEQIDIYSSDFDRIPPKLRLPTIPGKPLPIIVFAKQNSFFFYNTQRNSGQCDRSNNSCYQSNLADHSDDPRHASMRTALLAHGPVFKKGHINQPVLVTDIYALLRQILCLSPFPGIRRGSFHIHNMLDLQTLEKTCLNLYSSSVNMIKSIATKPIVKLKINDNSEKLVRINITEKHEILDQNLVKMKFTID